VALKVPNFGADSGPETRQRFFREARTAATFDHPNLCPVYDAGEIDGYPYLTMAYIEGRSLADWIRTDGLPPLRIAVLLMSKLAQAMQAAHTLGIIHRDLKPANIMMKATGGRLHPIIVDFGLARRHDVNEVRLTRTGQIMGTIAYMAPEQIRDDRVIGPACDIYALGVILHELLTGQLPFRGSGLAVAGQILTQTPLPPSAYRPDLDPRLEAICLKAMARQVCDRYESMGRLAEALSEYGRSSDPPSGGAPSPRTAPPTGGEEPRPSGWCAAVARFFGKVGANRA
jgi:serine/threonine protein kinase